MIAILLAIAAPAQAAEAAAPSDEIVVIGRTTFYSLDGKRLQAAQRAFAADRPRFAPQAILSFTVRQIGARSLDGLVFTLVRDGKTLDVPLDAAHRFVLPPIDLTGWKLIANRAPGEIGLRAWVLSPGASEADRPMGDLRLQCRVSWALQKDQYSFIQRAGFDAIDGCASKRIDLWTSATRPIASAQVMTLGGMQALAMRPDGTRYRTPLSDTALPNDARLRLTFR